MVKDQQNEYNHKKVIMGDIILMCPLLEVPKCHLFVVRKISTSVRAGSSEKNIVTGRQVFPSDFNDGFFRIMWHLLICISVPPAGNFSGASSSNRGGLISGVAE